MGLKERRYKHFFDFYQWDLTRVQNDKVREKNVVFFSPAEGLN